MKELRKEVEIKCPHCGEEEKSTKVIGKNMFIYICEKCKNKYKVEYERIATVCCKL